MTAMPVQPGEEGTSERITGSSQSPQPTLASVTNDNIGDYIDLGNNIVGESTTTDDWRVLYVEGDTVYAILADCLPNSTGYAEAAGLETCDVMDEARTPFVYSVFSGDGPSLIDTLNRSSYWNGLANGISGALVTGSPTAELFMNSYNTKNGTNLIYTDGPKLSSDTTDYDLYVTHTSAIDECYSYWLASINVEYDSAVWQVSYSGQVSNNIVAYDFSTGIRPVVALEASTPAELVEGVWTVTQ